MPEREIRLVLVLDLDTDETIALAWLRRALVTLAAKIHRGLPETPNLPQDAR